MNDDSQLVSLQKACEAKEQEALIRHRDVERVVETRRQASEKVRIEKELLEKKLSRLSGADRNSALKQQDAGQLDSIAQYSERLRRDVFRLETVLAERLKELQMAVERSEIAEQELVEARMESRRVEKLIEERNMQALVRGSALEEAATDEMATNLPGKYRDS